MGTSDMRCWERFWVRVRRSCLGQGGVGCGDVMKMGVVKGGLEVASEDEYDILSMLRENEERFMVEILAGIGV